MFILDTNVLSTVIAAQPAPAVATWMLAQPSKLLFTASDCEAEILAGIAVLPQGRRRETLEIAARTMFEDDLPIACCLSIARPRAPMAICSPRAAGSAGQAAPRI